MDNLSKDTVANAGESMWSNASVDRSSSDKMGPLDDCSVTDARESTQELIDSLYKSYYARMRFLSRLVGVWPRDPFRTQKYQATLVAVALFHFASLQIIRMITANGDLEIIIDVIPTLIANMVLFVRLISTWANFAGIKKLLQQFEGDWIHYSLAEDQNILKHYAIRAKSIGKAYLCCIQGSLVVLLLQQLSPAVLDIVAPLTNHSWPRRPMFEAEYFVDSSEYYYPIVLHMVFCVQLGVWTVVGTDMVFVSCALHACGLCRIVGYRFERVFNDSKWHACDARSCDITKKVGTCIKAHKGLIRFTEAINGCYYKCYATQCILSVVGMTLIFFRLFKAIFLHELGAAVIHVMYIIAFCVPTSLISLIGQILLNSSSDLYDAIYRGQWYSGCMSSQRCVIIALRMAKEPLTLYFLHTAPMSCETLSAVLRTPLSYFTVLMSMYTENNAP